MAKKRIKTRMMKHLHLINPSVSQSVSQSVNQSISQSVNQSIS